MENTIVIIVVITVAFYIKYYIDKQKDTANLFVKKAENSQEKRPLSRETLRNINENRNNSYSRVKNTFFDLPCHNEELIFEDTEDEDEDFIFTKVVGVTQKNDDDVERQEILKYCYEGEKLILEYDFHNKYSKYAIKVCRANNGEQIGYLEDKLSQKIHFRDMSTATVYIDEIIGGTEDKPNLGCLIEIQFS